MSDYVGHAAHQELNTYLTYWTVMFRKSWIKTYKDKPTKFEIYHKIKSIALKSSLISENLKTYIVSAW